MGCAESLRVQAYFDDEVDAVAAAETEQHIEQCEECRALLAQLKRTRSALRRELAYERASPQLRARIAHALDQEAPAQVSRPRERALPGWRVRPFWLGALGGLGGAAVAATLAFLLLAPTPGNAMLDELVSAHVRSLMPSHLIDVVSTDRHTVKPWFAGHADVSPVVADFTQQGYHLVGGRADYLDRQRAAVVVYQHGAHVINVFSWASRARGVPGNTTRSGYHMVFWKVGDLEYCAVSDTGREELLALVKLLQDAGVREAQH